MPARPGPAVTAEGLKMTFGKVVALDGLDLEIAAGTVFGLLGPNGAGKTTLVRILATLLRPSAGRAQVLGHDVVAQPLSVRRRIGLAGQFAALDDELSGRENLEMVGRLYRLAGSEARRRASEVLERFDLTEAADRRVGTYSGGMRRRLDLGASLVGRPPVLLLDEPTTGLDPLSRQELWAIVDELRAEGTTVLLTTQYLEEVDRLAQRIGVVDHGRIVAQGTATELKAAIGTEVLLIRVGRPRQGPGGGRPPGRPRRRRQAPGRRLRGRDSAWRSPVPTPRSTPCADSTRQAWPSRPSNCTSPASTTCSSASPHARPSPMALMKPAPRP